MNLYSEQISSNVATLRIDVESKEKRTCFVEDDTFLNYRLAAVEVSRKITKDKPDIIWRPDSAYKNIQYKNGQLLLESKWEEGELNKVMVSMLANEMDKNGLHPFHSSAVYYKEKMILIVGGESNHGKSMSQLEGCRRGGSVFSTETTVINKDGIALYGSKNVYIRKRAKGTERSDLPDQDQGVAKFFDKEPEMKYYNEPSMIDLAIMPAIDGHFDTHVAPMGQFEKCYQSFHSVMNFFGLNQLLCGESGCVMPIIDTDERRQARGKFVSNFVRDIPYYMIHSKTPQITFEEIDKIIETLK